MSDQSSPPLPSEKGEIPLLVWPESMFLLLGTSPGQAPSSYVVLDVETNSLTFGAPDEVVTQIAVREVEDGEEVRSESKILDWTREPRAPLRSILRRLEVVRRKMEKDAFGDPTNVRFGFDADRMKREGEAPRDVLDWFVDRMRGWFSKKLPIVGHNVFFDERALSGTLGFYAGVKFGLGDRRILDTLGMVRSVWTRPFAFPLDGESPRAYFSRTCGIRRKPVPPYPSQCRLTSCVEYLGLRADSAKMHDDAMEDVSATHELYERLRRRVVLRGAPERVERWENK